MASDWNFCRGRCENLRTIKHSDDAFSGQLKKIIRAFFAENKYFAYVNDKGEYKWLIVMKKIAPVLRLLVKDMVSVANALTTIAVCRAKSSVCVIKKSK
jgi:hypothetical protein